jgi:hypothetical protein
MMTEEKRMRFKSPEEVKGNNNCVKRRSKTRVQ